jgi:hypothetical protein
MRIDHGVEAGMGIIGRDGIEVGFVYLSFRDTFLSHEDEMYGG